MKIIGQVAVSIPPNLHVKALFVANGMMGKEPWECFFEPQSSSFVLKHQGHLTFVKVQHILKLMRAQLGKEHILIDLPTQVKNILERGNKR